mgnify:CR=1 FL=1
MRPDLLLDYGLPLFAISLFGYLPAFLARTSSDFIALILGHILLGAVLIYFLAPGLLAVGLGFGGKAALIYLFGIPALIAGMVIGVVVKTFLFAAEWPTLSRRGFAMTVIGSLLLPAGLVVDHLIRIAGK